MSHTAALGRRAGSPRSVAVNVRSHGMFGPCAQGQELASDRRRDDDRPVTSRNANRRRHLRTRTQNLVAHLRVEGRHLLAPVDDISMGGLLARTTEQLPVGTSLSFDLACPGLKRPLHVSGVVVDLRPGRGIGIRFDGMNPDIVARLGELISNLGGFTTSLAADKPESARAEPAGRAPASAATTPSPAVAVHVSPSENETKLQAQLRSMVMELGRLQELVQQRETELHDARTELARLRGDANAGDAAQRVLGKLEIEKSRLDAQLTELRGRSKQEADVIQREATAAVSALARLLESVKRLP